MKILQLSFIIRVYNGLVEIRELHQFFKPLEGDITFEIENIKVGSSVDY